MKIALLLLVLFMGACTKQAPQPKKTPEVQVTVFYVPIEFDSQDYDLSEEE